MSFKLEAPLPDEAENPSQARSDSDWKRLESERDFYRDRMMMLEREKYRLRQPELMIVCDILANCQLLPDPDGARYGATGSTEPEAAERC